MNTHHPRSRFLFAFFLLMLAPASQGFAKTYIIQFGGTLGFTYFPNSLNVFVGDTIKWVGDFATYPLQSTSVPLGATTFGPVIAGDTFFYVIKSPGEYDFQNNKYSSIGMIGNFTAVKPLYGLSNDGREFYLGLLYPSYNTIATSLVFPDFNVVAFLLTYYDNDVSVSYFDDLGKEGNPTLYHILAGHLLKLPLDVSLMQMDTASDAPASKSCHIKSTHPLTVYYVSNGASAGGSYLALPVLGLGKNYVAASYNDNPGDGAFTSSSIYWAPQTFEYAGGEFEVIATEDRTNVKITPATTTVTGHLGSNTGSPHPFTVLLNRGQCYLARSNGRNSDNDISSSLIEASNPVVVISGHEDAFLGGVDGYGLDGRDFMIEQMTPVEFWDSTGYISVPLAEATPPGNEGHGDSYRIYTFDSANVTTHLNVQGISGGYDLVTHRLLPPPEKSEITAPVEAYSTNGKKFALMQYDERSQPAKYSPSPCPSMMTIVPMSRWKTSYFFPLSFLNIQDFVASTFINVISSNFANINVSIDGKSSLPISSLERVGNFNSVSNNFPTLKSNQYRFSTLYYSSSYFLSSNIPFAAYFYGFQNFSPNGTGIGNPTTLSFYDEYAAPAGMELNTGVTPSFIVDTTSTCSGWHVCVRDTGSNDPGLKAVILIDDPDGVYWQTPGAKFSNVTFDSLSSDYADGELHPHFHSQQSYCFDVSFSNPLVAASAPLAIVDNLGNAIILRLDRTASALKLSTNPPTLSRADSIVFPVKQIGQQICTTFVFKNTVAVGGSPLQLNSLQLTNSDTTYKIQAITPSLPHLLAAQDSITLQVCYTPMDSSRHQDSLVLHTDCFTLAISLDAHGATGLISAADLDFGSITAGTSLCKDLVIKNVGSAPFTLTRSFIVSDTVNFSCDSSKLPVIIKPDGSIQLQVCFHPKTEGSYSGGIDWTTDLEPSFAHSIKSHSLLTGQAIPAAGVKSQSASNSFSIRPNPASGNSVIVSFDGMSEAASLNVFDILGREVFQRDIHIGMSRIEIPIQNFPVGTYYARLITNTGIISQSFMKVK